MMLAGCLSELSRLARTNYTLYIVQLAMPDVAFFPSALVSHVRGVGCDENDAIAVLLKMLVNTQAWPDPTTIQTLEPILPHLSVVQHLLGWLADLGFAFDASWPIFAYLAKLHHVVLAFIARVKDPSREVLSQLLQTLLSAPRMLAPQNIEDQYLSIVWAALEDDGLVDEKISLDFLSTSSNSTWSTIVGMLALVDCCADKYTNLKQSALKLLQKHLSVSMFLVPWPIWNFLDRVALQKLVPIEAPHPYYLAVLPIREKVSDFVRACRQPYCDFTFFEIARKLQMSAGGKPLRVVEVGANLGDCSMQLLSAGIASHASVFEPVPELVECLRTTVNANLWGEKVSIIPEAAGSSVGWQKFLLTGRRFGSWAEVGNKDVYANIHYTTQGWGTARIAPDLIVRRTTVDNHILLGTDLLKISVPESLGVLQGAERTVSAARAVHLTVLPGYMEQRGLDLKALLQWLDMNGFAVDVVGGREDVANEALIDEQVASLKHRHAFGLVGWRDIHTRRLRTILPFDKPSVPGCAFG